MAEATLEESDSIEETSLRKLNGRQESENNLVLTHIVIPFSFQ